MKQEIKEKWLKALRSGEYSQTKGVLRDANGFCCLGVLCDLHQKETPNAKWVDDNIRFYNDGKMITHGILSEKVMEWSGLNNTNPSVFDNMNLKFIPLATLNDDGRTFNAIANLIEKDL